jgi:hypothetical protein
MPEKSASDTTKAKPAPEPATWEGVLLRFVEAPVLVLLPILIAMLAILYTFSANAHRPVHES